MSVKNMTPVLCVAMAIGICPPINAGGMQGSMFNLPPSKTAIDADERIGIVIVDVEDHVVIRPLDANGQPIPRSQFSGEMLIVRGSAYSFTLPSRKRDQRRVVRIQFFRSNAKETVPAQQTQILDNVIIANVPGRVLTMDVVVPRPKNVRVRSLPSAYPCQVAPAYRSHRRCVFRR